MKWKKKRPDSAGQPPGSELMLRERNIGEECIPEQARSVWSAIDPKAGWIAVTVYNTVMNPTGQPWHGQTVAAAAPAAFAIEVAECQEVAVNQSAPRDADYLRHAHLADQKADQADQITKDTDRILDDSVEFPPGSWGSGRETKGAHQADKELGAERTRTGDSRHEKREINRIWLILVAVVLTVLDVALLWSPLLNLGGLDSAVSLLHWLLALTFVGAQVFFIDLAVHRYRERERESTERWDAVSDYNRAVQRDLTAAGQPLPDKEKIKTADQELRAAYRWLLATVGVVGVIGVVRVAFLAREYEQSVTAATFFGAVVGLTLGGLILLLGWAACQGNRLGDRLRAGGAVVADIDNRIQQGEQQVWEAKNGAQSELKTADLARAEAEKAREWVVEKSWQGLLLATRWLGLDEPPVKHSDLVVPRKLADADTAGRQVAVVNLKLDVLDQWLAGRHDVVSQPGQSSPGTSAAVRGRIVPRPVPGHSGVEELHCKIDPPPAEPRWLLVVMVVAAVGIAFVAALIAPVG